MHYWPSTKLRDYEERNGLHAPLILPGFIPEGYEQHYNPFTKSYYLRPSRGIISWYKPKNSTMDEETIAVETVEVVEEAPASPETAPEATVEDEVEETTV